MEGRILRLSLFHRTSNQLPGPVRGPLDLALHSYMDRLRISTLNVNKGLSYDKISAINQFCQGDDIILLQETRGYKEETVWKRYLHRDGKFSFFDANSRGVAALCSLAIQSMNKDKDTEGRIASSLMNCGGRKIGVISVYCPNLSSAKKMQESYIKTLITLEKMVDDLAKETEYIVVGGDFNLIMDAEVDAEKVSASTYPIIVEELQEFLGRSKLVDAFRYLHNDVQAYTFAPKGDNSHGVFRRLDYLFVTEGLLPAVKRVDHVHCHFSEHKAVRMHLDFSTIPVQKGGLWRHNDKLLDDEDYVKQVSDYISEALQVTAFQCPDGPLSKAQAQWEYLKFLIGSKCRELGAAKAKSMRETKTALELRLTELERDLLGNKMDIEAVKAELDAFMLEEDKKAIFRSRVKFHENNEKLTPYFMRIINKNRMESNVIELKVDGKSLDPKDINDKVYDFYSELFRKRTVDAPNRELEGILNGLPKVPKDAEAKLCREITIAELSTTLHKRMNPGKSPGSDGLTVAFYKKFWNLLKHPMLDAFKQALISGQLTVSQRQSIIRLIRKKDKDPSILKNWRPISLMNVDAKIFSRLITARLETVITPLCSEEQLAYIKNRNITEGVRLLDFSIEHIERLKKQGYIVGFDFEKAFDSIDHNFIYTVLERFGLPPSFIYMIKVLYNGAESAVMNNGFTTKYFPLGRSCRQGDCLSPYLFILTLEPLLRLIKTNNRLKGFAPPGVQPYKLSVYADDITGFANTEEEIAEFITCIDSFSKASGLKLNRDKTEVLCLGDNIRPLAHPYLKDVKVVNQLKVTGIYFGIAKDHKTIEKANFEGMLCKMRNQFNSWHGRDITILGRVMLAKSHGLSLLQYVANCIEVPKWAINAIKKILYRFIYKGIDKITRIQASKPIEAGGLKCPIVDDLVAAAAIQWVRKARVYKSRPWARIINGDLVKLGGTSSLNALRTRKDDTSDKIYSFNSYLRESWQHLASATNNAEQTLADTTVWKNNLFRAKVKTKYYQIEGPLLMCKGYTRVGDFLDRDGRIVEAEGSQMDSFSLLERLEWKRAIHFIGKHLTSHNLKLRGHRTANSETTQPDLDSQEVFLYSQGERVEIGELTQSRILSIVASSRTSSNTPFMGRVAEHFNTTVEEISGCFTMIKSLSNDTKTRSFLFKLFSGLLYGNDRLSKFGYRESSKCDYCDEKETIFHLLLYCHRTTTFRMQLYTKIRTNVSHREALLGGENPALNYVLMMVNKFIYQRKFLELKLSLREFVQSLDSLRKVEEDIATRHKRVHKHNQKWTKIAQTGIFD